MIISLNPYPKELTYRQKNKYDNAYMIDIYIYINLPSKGCNNLGGFHSEREVII